MKRWKTVRTQAELDKVLTEGDYAEIVGDGYFTAYGSATVRASDSATVTASDSATVTASDSATVTAYDSATVTAYDSATVTAYGSATVTAYGSATVSAYGSATVSAYGSATVSAYGSATVTAYDSATVRAYDSATVSATPAVAVHRKSTRTRIDGGVIIDTPDLTVAENWLAYYGLTPDENGVVTLFKSVQDDFQSPHGADYSPGATPEAPDWRATNECGFGLHFSPRAFMALAYHDGAGQRFVACPVLAADLVPIGSTSQADKVKAPRVVTGCYEVDIDGQPLVSAEAVA